MTQKKRKKRNHIYPAGCLRYWERDGWVALRLPGRPEPQLVSIRDAAVRKRFYWTTLPDGTRVDEVEDILQTVEGPALGVIDQLDQLWPLDGAEKVEVAKLFALQLLRVPAWMDWHDAQTDKNLTERTEQDFFSQGGVLLPQTLVRRMAKDVHRNVTSDRFRLQRMLALMPKVASMFASMHWVLLEFDEPVLATSDQPVVVWPLDDPLRTPGPADPQGLVESLEVRVPLAPDKALVMTWHDPETLDVRAAGTHDQAARLNAFTIAAADSQWFHVPGVEIEQRSGKQGPVSLSIPGLDYGFTMAQRSKRRSELNAWVQQHLGSDDMSEIRTVAIRRAA